jgi:hypothetical protein
MTEEKEGEKTGMVVAIRIKPPDIMNTTTTVASHTKSNLSVSSPGKNLLQISTNNENQQNIYQYDFIHWSTGTTHDTPCFASQETVYRDIGQPVVENTLKGFNCSLFAYGQTVSSLCLSLCLSFSLTHSVSLSLSLTSLRALERPTPCSVEKKRMKELSLVFVGIY